jgi:hypothetical protein
VLGSGLLSESAREPPSESQRDLPRSWNRVQASALQMGFDANR